MTAALLLLAAAFAQPASPPPAPPAAKPPQVATDVAPPIEPLRIPGEISAAIMPYMTCMLASRGNNVVADPSDPRPPGVAVASDCSAQRADSARRANEMLRSAHRMNAGRRQAFIEQALGDIDRHFLPNGPVPSRPAGAMGSIDIPYQAIEPYSVYTGCVGDHFAADPRRDDASPANVRQANLDAVAACRDVRTQQLARAVAAQTDIRMYGSAEAARAAVRSAFDRFDRDYQIETIETPSQNKQGKDPAAAAPLAAPNSPSCGPSQGEALPQATGR
jgi:hypothetical protein